MTTDVADVEARPAQGGGEARAPRRDVLRRQLSRFSGLYLWAGFIVVFALWLPDTFLTGTTLRSIATDQAVTAVLALAVLAPLAAGAFDLSIGQTLGLSAVTCGTLLTRTGLPVELVIAICVALGATVGLVNGILVAVVGVNSFIATLGMTSILLAATERLANGQYIGPFAHGFQGIAAHDLVGLPLLTVYLAVLAVIAWYVLEHSPAGRRTYATGANAEAARLAGVATTRYVLVSFVLCGALAALAGVLLAAKLDQVDQTVGPSYLLPAYAACFLGSTQIKPGRFNVWGTVLAVFLLATGVKGLQLAGSQLWVTDLFNGVALVGAVSIAIVGQRRRGGLRRAV
jgi:ribose transport system permease protein